MPRAASPPHPDDLETAVTHFNEVFRWRYKLPRVTLAALRRKPGLDEELERVSMLRLDGVSDAICAVIARGVLEDVPIYAPGFVDGFGKVTSDSVVRGTEESYRGRSVILVNPLGAGDNWASVSGWFRQATRDRRRSELAALASERRPDEEANWALLDRTAAETNRAVILPPDEAFSAARAAEVSYIYEIPIETLRAWRLKYRGDRGGKKPGRPRTR